MFFLDYELVKLGRAFDRAWDRFLRMGMLNPANLSRSQETLARSILEKANSGERDEWRLARGVICSTLSGRAPAQFERRRYPVAPSQSSETTGASAESDDVIDLST
jgi:hypothetical protein